MVAFLVYKKVYKFNFLLSVMFCRLQILSTFWGKVYILPKVQPNIVLQHVIICLKHFRMNFLRQYRQFPDYDLYINQFITSLASIY